MKVFLGSTFLDLKEHRHAVLEILKKFAHHIEAMEFWEAASGAPLDHCLERVRNSDVYICLVAFRYGSVSDRGYSFTQHEYMHAQEKDKDILTFLMSENYPIPPSFVDKGDQRNSLDTFRKTLQQNHICSEFTSPEDLVQKVAESLGEHLKIKGIITPEEVSAFWGKMFEVWHATGPSDVRVDFEAKKSVLELLDDSFNSILGLERLVKELHQSNASLQQDLKETLLEVGLDTQRLEKIPYYKNPFINRNWEYLHMGFPNWLMHLRVHLAQLKVRYLEDMIGSDKFELTVNSELKKAQNELHQLLSTSYRIE